MCDRLQFAGNLSIRKMIRDLLQVRKTELHKLENPFPPSTLFHRYSALARAWVLSLWESKVLEGSSSGCKKRRPCEFWRTARHGSSDMPYLASASEGILDKMEFCHSVHSGTSVLHPQYLQCMIQHVCVWKLLLSVLTDPSIRILSVYNRIPPQSFGIQHRPSSSLPSDE